MVFFSWVPAVKNGVEGGRFELFLPELRVVLSCIFSGV